ncbi:MAG: HD domain-containing protein [Nitrospirae bacterium]|nr:HD domain-containing protein [Nitrospirota bacterium]
MTQDDLIFFKQWFAGFCSSFHTSDKEDNRNLILKEKHTEKVCANILSIAQAESLGRNDTVIAEAVALFHDVGRFPQYAKYKTFRDSVSINHGELGATVLNDRGILKRLPVREQEIITTAVKFHNAFRIPDLDDPESIVFLKLVRDADKLDIWRIFFEYFSEDGTEDKPSAVGLSFPDTPDYSKEVLDQIFNRQLIAIGRLKTLNDFKLTILSWVFDLNFRVSLCRAVEDNYIDRVAATLPRTDDIRQAVSFVHEYIRMKMEGGNDV